MMRRLAQWMLYQPSPGPPAGRRRQAAQDTSILAYVRHLARICKPDLDPGQTVHRILALHTHFITAFSFKPIKKIQCH